MGQSASQPERRADGGRPARRASVFRRSGHGRSSDEGQQDGLLSGRLTADRSAPPPRYHRSASGQRLSQLLHRDDDDDSPEEDRVHESSRRMAMLQRTRSTLRDMLRQNAAHAQTRDTSRVGRAGFLQHPSSYVRPHANGDGGDYHPPRLPSIDISTTFDHETFTSPHPELLPAASGSGHRAGLRFNPLRPDRPFRRLASLRRRRSPPPAIRRIGGGQDQAAMLSELLSIAAAATAATLMGDDHQAFSEARSLAGSTGIGDMGAGGEDGSFEGFLRALQNGRIASALRGGADSDGDGGAAGQQGPLNFFRMFRFGSPSGSSTGPDARRGSAPPGSDDGGGHADVGMVPIIIVGIRSITPNAGSSSGAAAEADLPPFIDALGSFPSPLPTHALGTHGHESIDSILRPPQNGTSFRHRRRASMGGFGMGRNRLSDRMDDQRDHRSPDRRRNRPWSVASSSSNSEPRPPPATPASPSPELSRISSRNGTPNHSRPPSFIANSMRDLTGDSRRNSALHRASAASPLSAHTEETVSLHSTHSSTNLLGSQDADHLRLNPHRRSDTAPNVHYPRFASGHPRRNGVVEPDNLPPLSRSSTSNGTDASNDRRNSNNDSRSWIIYVLGGSYPENHPILTTPSLFTENPTYEDMMLLSALLGPAKAPVASEEDVQSAGGIYLVVLDEDAGKTASLVAIAIDGSDECLQLETDQQCLVCLCNFELEDELRKLVKCSHLFHKECIDQWLTQGRNSCPLCRGQGVDEREKLAEASQPSSGSASSVITTASERTEMEATA